jgi:hypothetical protein
MDLAVSLDPLFFDGYLTGANLLAVVRNDGLGAQILLEKGNQVRKSLRNQLWPNEWQLPFMMGYVYGYELADFDKAINAFQEAGEVSGAPEFVVQMATGLSTAEGRKKVTGRIFQYLIKRSEAVGEPKEVQEQLILKARQYENG